MKHISRFLFSILLIAIMQLSVSGQEADTTKVVEPQPEQVQPKQEKPKKEKTKLSEKIYFGGNIGLSFGSYTRVGIYPLIAYKFTPKLSGGVKVSYEYISDGRYNETYTSSNYGYSFFARYRIVPPLYVHIEYEQMSYELYSLNGESNREWIPFLYAGAGYSKRLGGNSWLNVQVLFDLLQDERSPYKAWDPFISVGVGVGF